MKLDFYEHSELERIVARSAGIFGYTMQGEVASIVARKSRGTPRIANRYVKILRDYGTVGRDIAQVSEVINIFRDLGIDDAGLDGLDRKLLEILATQFAGKAVGLGTLASIVGEEESTIEEVVEPYLLKVGYIERTPRGRQITPLGERYLRGSL